MDRHQLYERCVQSPERVVAFLRSIHGGEPRRLGEDFCGTAAVAREWARQVTGGSAVAVDLDADVLERAAGIPGIEPVHGNVRDATDFSAHAADVIFVGNFSIGEIHHREDLVAYLRRSRERLRGGGVLVCDTYGGASAFRTGSVERSVWIEGGVRVRYVWEQREADPFSARVVNAMHFRLEREEEVFETHENAFVYHWRLWTVPELRDALREAGFATTEARTELYPVYRGEVVRASLDLAEGFIAGVVGRK